MMTSQHHVLEPAVFDELAAGGGGPDAIHALRTAQLSKHLLLAQYLLERWPGPVSERDTIADALDRAAAKSPEAFAEVLGAPLIGAWSAIAVRAANRGLATIADFRHLSAVAMVACAAAGVDGEADIAVRDGMASIPGLGSAVVPDVDTAQLTATGGGLVARAASASVHVPRVRGTDSAQWQPVRVLAAGMAGRQIALGLDDLDPYRHGHHAPPTNRLDTTEVDAWRGLFANAWQLIAEQLPERADELAIGLRTLIPLQQGDGRMSRSATLRHAFGVFGLTLPPSTADFAVTLVHEFQHSKLSAVLDLVQLSDPEDTRRYFAPWRVDPRPLAGLLQGVYAFVGVADTWRALRSVPDMFESAERQFAEARLQVDRGLAAVEESGALTPAGEVLAARLRSTTDAMLAIPLPRATTQAAELALEKTRERWLDRNPSAQ